MYVFYSYVLGGYHNFGLAQEMILSVEKMEPEKHQNLGRILYLNSDNYKLIYTKYLKMIISLISDEDLSCVINFVFSYYFLIAAFIWFVIFTYSLHTTFQSFGKFIYIFFFS